MSTESEVKVLAFEDAKKAWMDWFERMKLPGPTNPDPWDLLPVRDFPDDQRQIEYDDTMNEAMAYLLKRARYAVRHAQQEFMDE